ncbi:SgcJ/EcaC family oxidoreductase [Nocardia sputi]|uniref:SgcJ/EcaC family oxidoreductase n=1 Tax=Nocardia sputi TaxID=2943705 RepID=UPI0020BF4957|nr:SgcJ/EcaC family oxidoreductase [Nocardia sputi]
MTVYGTDPAEPTRPPLARLLAARVAAWAPGDGAAFAATFTADAYFVPVIGEFVHRAAELVEVMREGFDGFMKGTRLSEPEVTAVRFPAPNVAVMVIPPRGEWIARPGDQRGNPLRTKSPVE